MFCMLNFYENEKRFSILKTFTGKLTWMCTAQHQQAHGHCASDQGLEHNMANCLNRKMFDYWKAIYEK